MRSTACLLLLLFILLSVTCIKESQLDESLAASILNSELGDIDQLKNIMRKISNTTNTDILKVLRKELSSIKTSANISQMKNFYESILDSQLHIQTSDKMEITKEKFYSILKLRIQEHLTTNEAMKEKEALLLVNLTSYISEYAENSIKVYIKANDPKEPLSKDIGEIQAHIKKLSEQVKKVSQKPLKDYSSIIKESSEFNSILQVLETKLTKYYDVTPLKLYLPQNSNRSPVEQEILEQSTIFEVLQQISVLGYFSKVIIKIVEDLKLLDKLKIILDIILGLLNSPTSRDQDSSELKKSHSEFRDFLSKHLALQHELEANKVVQVFWPRAMAFSVKFLLSIFSSGVVCLIFFLIYKFLLK